MTKISTANPLLLMWLLILLLILILIFATSGGRTQALRRQVTGMDARQALRPQDGAFGAVLP
ncbi:hypothetical protein DBL03_02760, partial [Pseudomonas putida]